MKNLVRLLKMNTYETLNFINKYLSGNYLRKKIKVEEFIKNDRVCIEIYKSTDFNYEELNNDKKIIKNLINVLRENKDFIVYDFYMNEHFFFRKYFYCKFEIAISK